MSAKVLAELWDSDRRLIATVEVPPQAVPPDAVVWNRSVWTLRHNAKPIMQGVATFVYQRVFAWWAES